MLLAHLRVKVSKVLLSVMVSVVLVSLLMVRMTVPASQVLLVLVLTQLKYSRVCAWAAKWEVIE
jgi:hypothetical protein